MTDDSALNETEQAEYDRHLDGIIMVMNGSVRIAFDGGSLGFMSTCRACRGIGTRYGTTPGSGHFTCARCSGVGEVFNGVVDIHPYLMSLVEGPAQPDYDPLSFTLNDDPTPPETTLQAACAKIEESAVEDDPAWASAKALQSLAMSAITYLESKGIE